MKTEIRNLNPKKAGIHLNIPSKILKEVEDMVTAPLLQVWNDEIIEAEISITIKNS